MAGYGIQWTQLRLGLIVGSVTALLSFLVFFIDEVGDSLEDRYTLFFHTFTTQTLQPRAPVWLAGQPVGRVRSLEFLPPGTSSSERLRVELSLARSVQPHIRAGSSAQVITTGLVGQTVVNIVPEGTGKPLRDGGQLPTAAQFDPLRVWRELKSLTDSVGPVRESLNAVRAEAESGRGTIALARGNAQEIRRLVRDIGELSSMLDTLSLAGNRMAAVLEDPDVRAALARIGPRLGVLAELLREDHPAPYRDEFTSRLASISARSARLRSSLEAGQGTVGRMLHDDMLRSELRRTRAMLTELRAELAAFTEKTAGVGR